VGLLLLTRPGLALAAGPPLLLMLLFLRGRQLGAHVLLLLLLYRVLLLLMLLVALQGVPGQQLLLRWLLLQALAASVCHE
jgi:hypothetical protein